MIQLLIVANNRPKYLNKVLMSLQKYHQSIEPIIQDDTNHAGMAANIQAGWTRVLEREWDYLFHTEEDMVLLASLPFDDAIEALKSHPHVANMIFQRQPWNDIEQQAGGVHVAIAALAPNYINHETWGEHDHIFSLNPCLIPRHIVEMGWPVGNEAEQTRRLLDRGHTFGVWGQPTDPPLVDHIGVERGPGWKL